MCSSRQGPPEGHGLRARGRVKWSSRVGEHRIKRADPDDVLSAVKQYHRLGPERFFAEHGFGPSRSYGLVWEKRAYPHKAIWARPTSWPRANAWPRTRGRIH